MPTLFFFYLSHTAQKFHQVPMTAGAEKAPKKLCKAA
jgi:hypothetical protein